MKIADRLEELHIQLPEVAAAGNYSPVLKSGRHVYVSGQLPKTEGRIAHKGRVGREVTLESARKAARLAIINCLAALQDHLGSLDKVQRIVKVTGYITSAVGFTEQHKVMDAASDLLVDIFGPTGKHARAAVGVVELPLGACIEIDMIVETKGL